jgi:hypothetical protein
MPLTLWLSRDGERERNDSSECNPVGEAVEQHPEQASDH